MSKRVEHKFVGGVEYKRCSKCGQWKELNEFNKNKSKWDELRSACKECEKEYRENNKEKILKHAKEYRENNKEKIAKREKEYRENNKEKIAKQKKEYRENNKEKIAKRRKEYRENNKEKIAKCNKKYYENNKEKIAERNKKYRENNKEKIANYKKEYHDRNREQIANHKKEYYDRNREQIANYKKEYYDRNREQILNHVKEYYERNREQILNHVKEYYETPAGKATQFNNQHKRRQRVAKNGGSITKEQWLECMKYFGWRDAYTGEYMKNKSLDHVIPVTKNGSGNIWNLVPCERSINSSKHNKDLEDWYKKQSFFSEERLAQIYEWQEYAYNKYND